MFNSLDGQGVVDSLMGSCEDYISDVTHPELASDNKIIEVNSGRNVVEY